MRNLGAPLRPALLWMDCRAAAEWLVPKAMWLAANEPRVYAEADVLCECPDYVNFVLTGRWAARAGTPPASGTTTRWPAASTTT